MTNRMAVRCAQWKGLSDSRNFKGCRIAVRRNRKGRGSQPPPPTNKVVSISNTIYSDAVLRMREDVATGQSLQLTMKQQDLFPHMVIQMVAIGEESGSLDHMLGKVADFFEEEVDNAVDALSSLLEPFIMVIIGGLVGSLVVAMYLPIFKMASVV